MKTIISKHHKSVWHVQNELFLGHMEFCFRRNKINPWNAYFWKQQYIGCAANEFNKNGMFLFQAQTAYLKILQLLVESLHYMI